MGLKRTIARNTFWNWVGIVSQMGAGFIVSPFLVNQLGDTVYGLWLLIASLTGYFFLLDLGMRGSVGRNVAFYAAKGDERNVNVMFNTALFLLLGTSLIAVGAVVVLHSYFLGFFGDIPTSQIESARVALLIVGSSFALTLPLNLTDAMLWGLQRFDLINKIDITAVVLRTLLTFYFVARGYGIVFLAILSFATYVGIAIAKGVAIYRVYPATKVSWRYVTRDGAAHLFNYGIWSFALSISRLLTSQFSTLIVGARLGISVITPYSIASRLLSYGVAVVSSSAGVLTPVATGYHAGDQEDKQRFLYLNGGKFLTLMSLFLVSNFILLGRPFIRIWMGPAHEDTATLLYILAIGDILPMGQLVTTSIILGKGRPRLLAAINMSDGLIFVTSALILSGPFGLKGVCIGFAVSGFLIRGVVMALWGAKLVGVSPFRLVTHALLPALATAAIPAATLAAVVAWRSPRGWTELFLYGGGFTAIYLLSVGALIGIDRARAQPSINV